MSWGSLNYFSCACIISSISTLVSIQNCVYVIHSSLVSQTFHVHGVVVVIRGQSSGSRCTNELHGLLQLGACVKRWTRLARYACSYHRLGRDNKLKFVSPKSGPAKAWLTRLVLPASNLTVPKTGIHVVVASFLCCDRYMLYCIH